MHAFLDLRPGDIDMTLDPVVITPFGHPLINVAKSSTPELPVDVINSKIKSQPGIKAIDVAEVLDDNPYLLVLAA